MTDNPLFDTRSPRFGKSLLTPELKKRFGQSASDKITGYSCDMMIIDDPLDNPNITQENIDKQRDILFDKSLDYAYQLSKQSRVRNYD
jgi:hypothetical protein